MNAPLPTKPIESATVFFSGDPSVGIPPCSFNVELFIDLEAYGSDEKERRSHLLWVRNQLSNLYQEMQGEEPSVMFDFECEEERQLEDKMEEPQTELDPSVSMVIGGGLISLPEDRCSRCGKEAEVLEGQVMRCKDPNCGWYTWL